MAIAPRDARQNHPEGVERSMPWRQWGERLRERWLAPLGGLWPNGTAIDDGCWDDADLSSLMLVAGLTSIKGDCRKTNQDRCYCDCGLGVFLVADGMGGRLGGEEASRIAVERIPWHLSVSLPDDRADFAMVKSAIENAVRDARADMIAFAAVHPDCQHMGTALALAVVIEDVLYIAHVGDCRVYHLRENDLRLMTCDHTLVQTMVDAGLITESEAESHPWRHQVVNWVGVQPSNLPPEITALRLRPGDRFMLASDGLTGVVDDAQLGRILKQEPDPQRAAQQLVGQAVVNVRGTTEKEKK